MPIRATTVFAPHPGHVNGPYECSPWEQEPSEAAVPRQPAVGRPDPNGMQQLCFLPVHRIFRNSLFGFDDPPSTMPKLRDSASD